MKETIVKLYNRFRNLILYGLIGGFCAGLDFCVYTVLCHYDVMPYLWANVISIHVGIFTSFILNRQINFKVKNKTALRFMSFYTVGLVGLGISELMLYLMVTVGGWNELVCKLISIVVVALIQFILNKYVTFKHHKK
jgi:putative flippase GtrA